MIKALTLLKGLHLTMRDFPLTFKRVINPINQIYTLHHMNNINKHHMQFIYIYITKHNMCHGMAQSYGDLHKPI